VREASRGSRAVWTTGAALAVALLGTTGCAGGLTTAEEVPVADVSVEDDDGLAGGSVLPTPYALPHVSLLDTAGRPYDLATDARTRLTLVFFGYTSCPDVCQVVLATVASALTRLEPGDRSKVGLVFVTTDPARDTAPVLRAYLDRFDPRFEGLTGDLRHVERLGAAMGVAVAKGHRLATGGYDVVHGTQVVGVLPGGRAPYLWTPGFSPAGLAADLTAILDGDVAPRPGRRR
jgi:protein SCO1/2